MDDTKLSWARVGIGLRVMSGLFLIGMLWSQIVARKATDGTPMGLSGWFKGLSHPEFPLRLSPELYVTISPLLFCGTTESPHHSLCERFNGKDIMEFLVRSIPSEQSFQLTRVALLLVPTAYFYFPIVFITLSFLFYGFFSCFVLLGLAFPRTARLSIVVFIAMATISLHDNRSTMQLYSRWTDAKNPDPRASEPVRVENETLSYVTAIMALVTAGTDLCLPDDERTGSEFWLRLCDSKFGKLIGLPSRQAQVQDETPATVPGGSGRGTDIELETIQPNANE